MGYNKGEWSELYVIMYLLVNRNLKLVDSSLNLIADNIFEVVSIHTQEKKGLIEFNTEDDYIIPIVYGEIKEKIYINEIERFYKNLYNHIKKNHSTKGAFTITKVDNWLKAKELFFTFKGSSYVKEDIIVINLDDLQKKRVKLGYSVKSQLGNPATILNASSQTNFKYQVIGIKDEQIDEINCINTKQKLVDRLEQIQSYGAKIQFEKVESKVFDENLQMIDSILPEVLAEILLNSYITGEKNLRKLFTDGNVYSNPTIAKKKLEDFLIAISLGMFPSKKWNGEYTANGGLIIVAKDSNVYVLDNIYHSKHLKEYLVNRTKLDTPSSSRYNMVNLYKENDKVYFTLNLQVRYIN